MKKRIVIAVITAGFLLVAVAVAVFTFGPGLVESRMNRVRAAAKPAPSDVSRAFHSTLFVADLHADTLLWNRNLLIESGRGHVDIPRLAAGNVALQMFTVVTQTPRNMNYNNNASSTDNVTLLAMLQCWPPATWSSRLERALYQARRLHDAADNSGGTLSLIESQEDFSTFMERRKTQPRDVGCLLGIEGLHCLEGSLENVDVLFSAGFRMMGPAHFFDNEVGGSAHGVEKRGLSEFGLQVVRRMEECHIVIDLAHASPKLIDDILRVATHPVICSHTGVKGTCDNGRNLSDDHLRRIAQSGGLIGIGYWDSAVCGNDVASIVAAIRYAVNVAGVDHIALGSDFDGAVTTPFDASGVVTITDGLLAAGVAEEDIAKIMGENVQRFFMQALPPA
ncbi:MAG: dipeptidase [Candidatus Hydrogenedentes bacterium]|nr:dipeptidase [Candidatus Hydrogenedentota bacterium]